jgi:hypothetical protein
VPRCGSLVAPGIADKPHETAVDIDQLSDVARSAVYRQVGIAAEGLLDFDLTDALVAGWLKYKALVDAARRTLGSSAREVVPLVSHRITSTYSSSRRGKQFDSHLVVNLRPPCR